MKLAGRLLLLFISSIILGIGLQLYKRGCIYMDDENRLSDFSDIGRVFITGANTGIGLETARGLVRRGINVILGCRNMDKCKNARDILTEEKINYKIGKIDLETIDLTSLESVRDCAHRLKLKYTDLRVLVNNAGFMGSPLTYTAQGVESHVAVNHLAHFLLTKLLLDHMKSNLPPVNSLTPSNSYEPIVRIINVASNLHAWTSNGFNLTHPGLTQAYALTTEYTDELTSQHVYYHPLDAYSQSKLANVLFARQLAKQEKENNKVISVSLHPGVIATELMRNHNSIIQTLFRHFGPLLFVKTPWEGAQTTLNCILTKASSIENGAFYTDCEPIQPTWPNDLNSTDKVDAFALKLWQLSEKFVAPYLN